jgi:CDP-6-deoxy-D-xylo-4-hexulose-3-dehydrase
MSRYRYPCTGHTPVDGFGLFLAEHLGEPRANLQAFERELCASFRAGHAVLTNSGSSATLAAAVALAEECRPGDEAVVAGFTFPTTASALLTAGFGLRVVDTERDGFGMDPEALRQAIGPRTRLVCLTHFLGFPAQLEEITAICRESRLLLLQDACETMDLVVCGRPAHAAGTLTTWSFYHPHHLSSFGGGAVVVPDDAWRQRVESIVHWGRACTCHADPDTCQAPPGMDHNFWYVRRGYNLEMSELNACFGRFQLRTWSEQERARQQHYQILWEALQELPGVVTYPAPSGSGSPFVFPVTRLNGDVPELANRLAVRGVEVRSLMGGAITGQPAYRGLPHDGLPRCRSMSVRSFFVGIHQTLPADDVRAVGSILREEFIQ